MKRMVLGYINLISVGDRLVGEGIRGMQMCFFKKTETKHTDKKRQTKSKGLLHMWLGKKIKRKSEIMQGGERGRAVYKVHKAEE